jgi:hypothetical protein
MKHDVAARRQKSLVGSFCPLKPSPRAIFLCKDYNYNLFAFSKKITIIGLIFAWVEKKYRSDGKCYLFRPEKN